MKRISKRKIFKICLVIFIVIYISFIFIKQQTILNSYKNEKNYLNSKISEEKENKNELLAKIDNVNSKEYIEQVAREKLNMYLPNERVYVDVGN